MEPEPETLRLHKTEIDHIQQKSYQVVPAYCLNYVQIINTKGVVAVSVSQIKKLAERLSPNDVFPQIKGFSENQFQELAEKLLIIKDIEFLYTLCTIIFMCLDEGIDILRQLGFNITAEHRGEQVVKAYFSNEDDKFETALNHLLFTSIAVNKTHYVFQSKTQISKIEDLQATIHYIEAECRKHFKNLKFGKYFQIRVIHPIQTDKRLGFFINHAGNLKTKPFINPQDKMSLFRGRSLVEDFIVYDPSLDLVFISSRSPKNCEFYSGILGTVFCNNENVFKQYQLNLHVIKKQNIHQLLANCCIGRITQVQIERVRSVVKTINNNKTTDFRPPIGKKCLTHNNNGLVIEGNITEVELKIKLSLGKKDRSQKLILRPTSVKSDQLISPFEVQHIFKQLELIRNEDD